MVIVVKRVTEVSSIIPCLIRGGRDNPTPSSFMMLVSFIGGIITKPLTFVVKGKLLLIGSEPLEGCFQICEAALCQLRVLQQVARSKANSSKLS